MRRYVGISLSKAGVCIYIHHNCVYKRVSIAFLESVHIKQEKVYIISYRTLVYCMYCIFH